jgi:creatinine amidohydrolase
MHLADVAWTDVRDADTDLALLPVGSTEQHGPHAPLGTDCVTAAAVAEAGAAAHDDPVVVAPTIPVGVAAEHRRFDGTLWVSPDTFRAYVRETVESLFAHGFDRVVVVNGHGGNVDALREVTAEVIRAGDGYVVPFTWFDSVDAAEPMGHGGALETALLRHVAPEAVREERVPDALADGTDRWGEWVAGVNLAVDSDEFSENGVVGDPTAGDAAMGERLLDEAGTLLSALLDAVAAR